MSGPPDFLLTVWVGLEDQEEPHPLTFRVPAAAGLAVVEFDRLEIWTDKPDRRTRRRGLLHSQQLSVPVPLDPPAPATPPAACTLPDTWHKCCLLS